MVAPEPAGSPAVGLIVLITQVPARLRRVVVADGLMIRPDRLLLHANAFDDRVRADTPTVPRPRSPRSSSASPGPGCATPAPSARIGVRALPADHSPVVNLARDGRYVVATHSGITLAALLGRLVAEELLDHRPSEALTHFRPARFQEAAA